MRCSSRWLGLLPPRASQLACLCVHGPSPTPFFKARMFAQVVLDIPKQQKSNYTQRTKSNKEQLNRQMIHQNTTHSTPKNVSPGNIGTSKQHTANACCKSQLRSCASHLHQKNGIRCAQSTLLCTLPTQATRMLGGRIQQANYPTRNTAIRQSGVELGRRGATAPRPTKHHTLAQTPS